MQQGQCQSLKLKSKLTAVRRLRKNIKSEKWRKNSQDIPLPREEPILLFFIYSVYDDYILNYCNILS